MTAIDLPGQAYMNVALLFLAPGMCGLLRWALLANSALAAHIFLQLFWPGLILMAAPWLVTFHGAMILLAVSFRR